MPRRRPDPLPPSPSCPSRLLETKSLSVRGSPSLGDPNDLASQTDKMTKNARTGRRAASNRPYGTLGRRRLTSAKLRLAPLPYLRAGKHLLFFHFC